MPLSARQQKRKTDEVVRANAPPQQLSEQPRRRPYLLKMLQNRLGTRVLADTLDWDGELRVFLSPHVRGPRPPLAMFRPVGNCEKYLKFLSFFFSLFVGLSFFIIYYPNSASAL